MKSTRQLRLRLRLIEGALLLLLGILTAGAVATRQLLLDTANHPTTDISLSSAHWTGTLDAARLPASVPLYDDSNNLTLPSWTSGLYQPLQDGGPVSPASIQFSGAGPGNYDYSDISFYATDEFNFFGAPVAVNLGLQVTGSTSLDNGAIYTDGTGNMYFGGGSYGISDGGAGYFSQFDADDGYISSNGSGTLSALYFCGDGSQLTNVPTPAGLVFDDLALDGSAGIYVSEPDGSATLSLGNGVVFQAGTSGIDISTAGDGEFYQNAEVLSFLDDAINLNVGGSIQTGYNAPGDLYIGDGSSGYTQLLSDPNTLGPMDGSALTFSRLQTNAVPFASAVSDPPEGTIEPFTDSSTNTWGATITGGGSYHVLGYYDGTNWTVMAK